MSRLEEVKKRIGSLPKADFPNLPESVLAHTDALWLVERLERAEGFLTEVFFKLPYGDGKLWEEVDDFLKETQ